jgi:hypothetical protein
VRSDAVFVIWRQQALRNQSLSASGASFDRLRMSGERKLKY